MRKLLKSGLFIGVLLLANASHAQIYLLNNASNGTTVNTCSGLFFDSGNSTGNYGANENYTITLTPGLANRRMRLDFTDFNVGSGDSLEIFDGTSTAATRLAVYKTGNSPVNLPAIISTAGSLTVRFRSDAGIATLGTGWRALIRCAYPCQTITGSISTTTPTSSNGDALVCPNSTFTLTANVQFPQNGLNYNQTIANCNIKWQPGFTRDTAGAGLNAITRTISQRAGYTCFVQVTDSNGCVNNLSISKKIKVSIKPNIKAIGDTVCAGDSAYISAFYQLNQGSFAPPPLSGRSFAVPDIAQTTTTACTIPLRDTITVSGYAPGTTLSNVNDFLGVFMNMEHSFLGDLQFELTAPNGITVVLKRYVYNQGMNVFLGQPVDLESLSNVAGIGYEYGFTNNPTYGTMRTVGGGTPPLYSYIDNAGNQVTNQAHLAAGTYASEDPLNLLVGSPINGNWILKVCDNWTIDNGFLFGWRLEFAPSLLSNVEQYTIGAQNTSWVAAPGIVSSTPANATVFLTTAGTYNYTYRYIDSALCVYDTSVRVLVNPNADLPQVNNVNTCQAQQVALSVLNPQTGATYNWYASSNSNTIVNTGINYILPNVNASTSFFVQGVTNNGCPSARVPVQINILPPLQSPTVTLTTITPLSLTYSWTAVPGAASYEVSIDGSNYITPSSGPTGLTHTVNNLAPLQTITFYVRAKGTIPCQLSNAATRQGTTSTKEVFVPNAFSPNGDGKNDVLLVYGNIIQTLDFKVFDQWGNLVFQTNDKNKGWDGSVNGKQQPVGVYVFALNAVLQDNTIVNQKGSINLIR
jgi:gliding motility-associated-like protein